MEDDLLKLEELSTLAVKKGAKSVKLININQIVVADWVYWKCKFGCPDYGKTLTCPPYSPNPQQTRALLSGYEHALLLKYPPQDYHRLLLELERETFLRGFYSAWGLTAGQCRLCESCNLEIGRCLHPEQARPSMEACGIDVFATARKAGFDIKVLTSKNDKYQRICLLLVR